MLCKAASLAALATLALACDSGGGASTTPAADDARAAETPLGPTIESAAAEPSSALAAPQKVVDDEDLEPAQRAAGVAQPAREAHRASVAHIADEPLLRPHAASIRAHFAADSADDPAIELQSVARFGSSRTTALLTSGAAKPPFLVAIDGSAASPDSSTIAWSKDLPLAGTFPGATSMALTAALDDGAALAWFDPTTHLVALRKWRADSVVEADFVIGPMDACDSVSALFWPRHGWVVVASNVGQARAFLLGLSGMIAWPRDGIDVSLGRQSAGPISIAPVANDALLLVGVGVARSGARKAPEHIVALRLDADGTRAWDTPADLGPAPPSASRITATPDARGVRVELGPQRAAFVDATGAVHPTR